MLYKRPGDTSMLGFVDSTLPQGRWTSQDGRSQLGIGWEARCRKQMTMGSASTVTRRIVLRGGPRSVSQSVESSRLSAGRSIVIHWKSRGLSAAIMNTENETRRVTRCTSVWDTTTPQVSELCKQEQVQALNENEATAKSCLRRWNSTTRNQWTGGTIIRLNVSS